MARRGTTSCSPSTLTPTSWASRPPMPIAGLSGKRPKTGIYGEHLLWEEVARAVKPFLDGREVLPMTKHPKGKPWYRPHSKNAQSQFGNWWAGQRAAGSSPGKEGTRRLPEAALRFVAGPAAEHPAAGVLGRGGFLRLQHGKLGDDDLLKCYANLPFKKLFEATRELRTMFEPFPGGAPRV